VANRDSLWTENDWTDRNRRVYVDQAVDATIPKKTAGEIYRFYRGPFSIYSICCSLSLGTVGGRLHFVVIIRVTVELGERLRSIFERFSDPVNVTRCFVEIGGNGVE